MAAKYVVRIEREDPRFNSGVARLDTIPVSKELAIEFAAELLAENPDRPGVSIVKVGT